MAKLYFKYGAMNSGKSTALLQAANNYEENGMKTLILKPQIDAKGNNRIVSRLGIERAADYLISDDCNIVSLLGDKLLEVSCIFVDEAQFLSGNQIDDLLEITVDYDIPVICYGLRTDFQTRVFPGSLRLLEVAGSLDEIKTICYCGKKATFVLREVNGKPVFDGDQVVIDNQAKVLYKSLCPRCYLERKREANKIE